MGDLSPYPNPVPTLYRTMKADGDRPLLRASASGLGVRPGVDVFVDEAGYVQRDCGLSVTPEDPSLQPITSLKARSAGGDCPHPLWALESSDLPDKLVLFRDRATHGFIAPAVSMTPDQFAAAIESTRDLWTPQP